jgi:hypothetical protein
VSDPAPGSAEPKAQPATPALSVIVASPFGAEPVRQIIRHLALQTAKERLEILFVVPSVSEFDTDLLELGAFHSHRVVEVGAFESVNRARVAGIRCAGAPLVAFSEDHCFPSPTWAQALIAAHDGPWAAVGPAVGLANTHTWKTWSNYLIQYGPWTLPTESRAIDDVAGHNSSYKRDILLEYGDDLEEMMEFEFVLHQDLRRRGLQIYMAADAVAYHVFMTRLGPFLLEHLAIGQMLAACRARRASLSWRLKSVGLAPLVPGVRMYRIVRKILREGWRRDLLPGILPWLTVGLAVTSFGELLGYTIGEGRSARWTLEFDFDRGRFVSDTERCRIWNDEPVDFDAMPTRPAIGRNRGSGAVCRA